MAMSLAALQTDPTSLGSAKERYEWMDSCRGLGVLLITLVHAGSFLSEFYGEELPTVIRSLDLIFSPYRIPMLVFLSGIFLSHSLKKGVLKFATGKFRNILWPYLLWTAILAFLLEGASSWLNWQTWVMGGPAMWFLSFLMVYYLVGLLTARVPFLIIAIYALALSMVATAETRYGSRLFLLMSYFFVGAFLGLHMSRMLQVIKSRWALCLIPLVVALSVYFAQQSTEVKYNPFILPLIIGSIIGVCCLVNLLSGKLYQSFQFVGRNSIKYYVIHPGVYIILYQWTPVREWLSIYVLILLAFVLAVIAATGVSHWSLRDQRVNLLFAGPPLPDRAWINLLADWGNRVFLPPAVRP